LACAWCEEFFSIFEHLLACEERNSTELAVMLVDMAVHSQGIFESILDASIYCRCQRIILSDQYHLSLPATFPKCVWLVHSGIQQEMANNIGKTKLYPCIHS